MFVRYLLRRLQTGNLRAENATFLSVLAGESQAGNPIGSELVLVMFPFRSVLDREWERVDTVCALLVDLGYHTVKHLNFTSTLFSRKFANPQVSQKLSAHENLVQVMSFQKLFEALEVLSPKIREIYMHEN